MDAIGCAKPQKQQLAKFTVRRNFIVEICIETIHSDNVGFGYPKRDYHYETSGDREDTVSSLYTDK